MRVWVDPVKLNKYALTMDDDVSDAIKAQNAGFRRPAGRASGAQGADAQRHRLGPARA
jgi:multidrug efflux pump subunit AcrB